MPHTGSRKDAERRRRQAMTLLDQGRIQKQVSLRLGVTPAAVCQWVKARDSGGDAALKAKPHPGTRPKLDDLFANVPERGHFAKYQRFIILWKLYNGKSVRNVLVANRTHWEIDRILRVYRHRRRGIACFHRDGKQHLDLSDCYLKNGHWQTSGGRHTYLPLLAYSVLIRQLRRRRARPWGLQRLTTIGHKPAGR